jgi:transcriptional regulator of nitric oxide reductase
MWGLWLRYRRVEMRMEDENIVGRKMATAMGFTLEGVLRKHRVVREANWNTAIFSLTNSDWREGAQEGIARRLKLRAKSVRVANRSIMDELDKALNPKPKEE